MFLMTAAVNSEVVAEPGREDTAMCEPRSLAERSVKTYDAPPMSAVRTLPALMTSKVALAMLFARWSRLSAKK